MGAVKIPTQWSQSLSRVSHVWVRTYPSNFNWVAKDTSNWVEKDTHCCDGWLDSSRRSSAQPRCRQLTHLSRGDGAGRTGKVNRCELPPVQPISVRLPRQGMHASTTTEQGRSPTPGRLAKLRPADLDQSIAGNMDLLVAPGSRQAAAPCCAKYHRCGSGTRVR
jgi:hypothetical protein